MLEKTLTAKKSLGQNFLRDNTVPAWLAEAGDVTAGDRVLEIGPGTGVLTAELLHRGALVTAIETDTRMIPVLEEKFETEIATKKLTIITGDVRKIKPEVYAPLMPYKVVANIPYYLSGFLLRQFLESSQPPTTLVFLMQKEVVERITRDKKGSILAYSVAAFGIPNYIKTVKRGNFTPPPKVDSAILQVTDISHTNFQTQHHQTWFFTLLHAGFGTRRKQLINTLKGFIPPKELETWLLEHQYPKTIRAEDVSLEDWLKLAHHFTPTSFPE